MTPSIRAERADDIPAIAALIERAFAGTPHSDGTEATIVARLREAGSLTVSLVAESESHLVGHVAISPVTIGGRSCGWFGLGPVAVDPGVQRNGTGAALVGRALDLMREKGAGGCVVLGDPAYYARFGFAANPALVYPGVPPAYFQAVCWSPPAPSGIVAYHPAFTG